MKKYLVLHFTKINLFLIVYFISIFCIYIRNLTVDVYGGDIGDLVTASYHFGVAHPSGYPLFTLLGYGFSHIPLYLPIVSRIGLISVIASIIGLIIFYKISYIFSKNYIISILSTSILAFSYLFWLYSEIPEVFALNNLFVILLFYLAYNFSKTKRVSYLYLLSFFSALAITNHQTIIFIFPSILILILKHFKFIINNKKRLGYIILLLILGLSPYLTIPLAASHNPIINWDNAINLHNFIHLFFRMDYGSVPPPVSHATFTYKLLLFQDYISILITSITLPVFCFCIIGLINLFMKDKRTFFSLIIGFILSGFFYLYYGAPSIQDPFWLGIIERFYLMSTIIFLFFLPNGLVIFTIFIKKILPNKDYSSFFLTTLFVIPLILFIFNIEQTNLSHNQTGNNLGYDILNSASPNSAIFLIGDTMTFNTWYIQYEEGYRKDVLLVNTPAINSHQIKQIGEDYFKTHSFDKFNVATDGIAFAENIKKKRDVYYLWSANLPNNVITWIPYGLLFKLSDTEHIPSEAEYLAQISKIWSKLHIPYRDKLFISERGLTIAPIPTMYADSLIETGKFIYTNYHDYTKAAEYYKTAILIDEGDTNAYDYLALTQYLLHDCSSADDSIQSAIRNTSDKANMRAYYFHSYMIYTNCKNKNMLEKIKKDYKVIYKTTLDKDYNIYSHDIMNVLKEVELDKKTTN